MSFITVKIQIKFAPIINYASINELMWVRITSFAHKSLVGMIVERNNRIHKVQFIGKINKA